MAKTKEYYLDNKCQKVDEQEDYKDFENVNITDHEQDSSTVFVLIGDHATDEISCCVIL